MPAVSGVAERAEIRIMRRNNEDAPSGADQPVKFLHCADYVGDVLDDMDRAQLIESSVAKRVRKTVEVADDVSMGIGIQIDSNSARVLVDSTADVENARAARAYA